MGYDPHRQRDDPTFRNCTYQPENLGGHPSIVSYLLEEWTPARQITITVPPNLTLPNQPLVQLEGTKTGPLRHSWSWRFLALYCS